MYVRWFGHKIYDHEIYTLAARHKRTHRSGYKYRKYSPIFDRFGNRVRQDMFILHGGFEFLYKRLQLKIIGVVSE